MARDWEAVLSTWAKPPSDTELEKAANAESVIRKAIDASTTLAARSVSVFVQGSYRNRTNVRQDSDVDINVLCRATLFADYTLAPGMTDTLAGLSPAPYQFPQYRNDVQGALVSYLGAAGITRGNKAFDVHPNTYRLDADVVTCFEFRQYQRNADGSITYEPGVAFLTDTGVRVHNWPQQNYDNGVQKNENTGRFYKPSVRIFKRLRNEMAEAGYRSATSIPSFLIESILFNLPNGGFQEPTWTKCLRRLLAETNAALASDEVAREMVEVNHLKYLFRGGQPWTLADTQRFIVDAWQYHHI